MTDDSVTRHTRHHLPAAHREAAAFRSAARRYRGSRWGTSFARLAEAAHDDLAELEWFARRTGNEEEGARARTVRWASRISAGAGVLRSAVLPPLAEIERLRAGLEARLVRWEVMLAAAAYDDRLPRAELERLIESAHKQAEELRALHLQMAQQVFSPHDEFSETG